MTSCRRICWFGHLVCCELVSSLVSVEKTSITCKMGAAVLPVALITAFWAVIGIVLPIIVPKGPSRGVIQVVLMLTAACCWLFWLICYMGQMNPLIGPRLSNHTLFMIAKHWDGRKL